MSLLKVDAGSMFQKTEMSSFINGIWICAQDDMQNETIQLGSQSEVRMYG